jgi:hypothetical protein
MASLVAWLARLLEGFGGVAAGILLLTGVVAGSYRLLGDKTILAWQGVAGAALIGLLLAPAYLLGRRSYRQLQRESSERAREELEITRTYLKHIVDFMGELQHALARESADEKVALLADLRRLVFVAIAQGVKRSPGEYIRCAFLEPAIEDGREVLLTEHFEGHTAAVRKMRLELSSVAGRAYVERRGIYEPHATESPIFQQTAGGSHPVETLLCYPAYGFVTATSGPQPVGVISVTSSKRDAFAASDQEFIYICAQILGLIAFFSKQYEHIAALETRRHGLLRRRGRASERPVPEPDQCAIPGPDTSTTSEPPHNSV